MSQKIVCSNDLSGAPEAIKAFQDVGQLVQTDADRTKVLAEIEDCVAYMAAAHVQVDKDFLDKATKLKLIGSPNTGRDHLDLVLIQEKGITLFDIAEEQDLLKSFTATSELAFGLLLALVRKIPNALQASEKGYWAREHFTGFQLSGKTFGILGLGRLGQISARIAQGFGMHVIANDAKDVTYPGVEMVDFKTLLSKCDILSLHVHLNEKNEHFINSEAIKLMKNNAIIINTSRGRIIDETALLSALHSKSIAGAALDVIDGEWMTVDELSEHPLIKFARENNNLIISPHIGGSTVESIHGARIFMARKMAEFLKKNLL